MNEQYQEIHFLLSKFQLHRLQWNTDSVSKDSFELSSQDPTNFLSDDVDSFKTLDEMTRHLETISKEKSGYFWSYLSESKIKFSGFLGLLDFWIKEGNDVKATFKDRNLAFVSCSVYFLLLSLPGNGTFRVFNSNLYQRALDIFKKASKEELIKDKELVKAYHQTLQHFLIFLENFSFKHHLESLEISIQQLVHLTHLETQNTNFNFNYLSVQLQIGISSLAHNAYQGLLRIISSDHGKVSESLKWILYALLPSLTMSLENDFRASIVIRNHSLQFVKYVIEIIGEESLEATDIFLQNLMAHYTVKADSRSRIAEAVFDILSICPEDFRIKNLQWILAFSYSKQSNQRLLCVELMELFSFDPQIKSPNYELILGVLLDRAQDASPKVRGKAFRTLAEITSANDNSLSRFISSFPKDEYIVEKSSEFFDYLEYFSNSSFYKEITFPLPSQKSLFDLFSKFSKDDSSTVRKSTLVVLENMAGFSPIINEELFSILVEHVRDPSLSIRKQIFSCLTDLLKKHQANEFVIKNWVKCIFPAILDPEQKASERAYDCIWQCVFDNLINDSSKYSQLPWKILQVSHENNCNIYLSIAVKYWSQIQMIKPSHCYILQKHISFKRHEISSWRLLSLISHHVTLNDHSLFLDCFHSFIKCPEKKKNINVMLHVLPILCSSLNQLSHTTRKDLQDNLLILLQEHRVPCELISSSFDLTALIAKIDGETNLIERLTSMVETIIQYLESQNDKHYKLERIIFSLGEYLQLIPFDTKEKKIYNLLQKFLFHKSLPNISFSSVLKLKALTIISLNKMAIISHEIAQNIVSVYGALLLESHCESLKNNIVFGLTDLCVRYTNLVEPLLPQMTSLLKDSCPHLRKTCLSSLYYLLQEDYLKLNGRPYLVFRLLQTLVDSNDEIVELSSFFFTQRVRQKCPNIMYQYLLEGLFHYNNQKKNNNNSNQESQNFEFEERFCISSPLHHSTRMKIYKFMLENMSDEQRFKMTYKLCQEVIGEIVADKIEWKNESQGILKDTLAILSSDEIKLSSLKTRKEEEFETEDLEGAVRSVAKKTIISQVVKKNIVHNMLPLLLSLKRKLENGNHQSLIGELRTLLKELLKNYKNDVKELLEADKVLGTEIHLDLKRLEETPSSHYDSPSRRSKTILVHHVLHSAIKSFSENKDEDTILDSPSFIEKDPTSNKSQNSFLSLCENLNVFSSKKSKNMKYS